jgi:hypothetical protein
LRRPCCTSRHHTYPLLYTPSIPNYKSLKLSWGSQSI